MHISLDSALGRQRRLNSVGESVFQIAPNAAAGYSLRSLTGGDPAVVRVRRESDNAERDFNASGVSSGELVNWVNQQITPPLDLRELTATGRDGPIIDAAAAYSLRNLSDSYTGNVVEVRRSSDDAEDSFTAAEVADGTMVAWVGAGNDGFVSQWYDQSGNDNHATQGTDASQPKIVDGGALVSGGIKFDGTQKLEKLFPSGFSGKEQSHFVKFTPNSNLGYLVEFGGGIGAARSLSVEPYLRFNGVTQDYDSTILSGDSLLSMVCPDAPTTIDGYDLYYQGSLLTPDSLSGGTLANVTSSDINIGDGAYIGKISEAILYNSDQSANRVALEANIGEVYGIAGIPAYDDTVNGFVETWYDQSGNGNDATQSVAGLQPRIVDAGALVAGGIDFSTSQSFEVNISVTRSHLFSVFRSPNVVTPVNAVHLIDDTQNFQTVHFLVQTPTKYIRFLGSNYTQDVVSMNTDGTDNLVSALNQTAVQGGSSLHINGSPMTIATTDSDSSMVINKIGKSLWSNVINQVMAEWIIYNSDQSANRAAIETNINNQYDIYS